MMTEELEQLLKNLRLRRVLEVYDERLLLGVPHALGACPVACAPGGCFGVAYQSVKSILKNSLDVLPVATNASVVQPSSHAYIRGLEYFN